MEKKVYQSKIAVIIPAYNEALTIEKVIEDFATHAEGANIFVIDNASKDETSEIAKKTLKKFKNKGCVIPVLRKGKANAMRVAFENIEADIYVMVDADCTYKAKDLKMLMKPVLQGKADIVVGDRLSSGKYQKENKRAFHQFGNSFVVFLINKFFRAGLTDVMSGYRIFNKNFVKNFPILSEGFELETEMTLFALHYKFHVQEIPIEYVDRPQGSHSKLNTITDGIKVMKTIFNIFQFYQPMAFYLTLSMFFLLISLIIGSFPIYEYFEYKYVHKVPSAIFASGCMILSLLTFGIGVILRTINTYQKMNFRHKILHYQ